MSVALNPELGASSEHDPHITIARFLDESAQRAYAFLGWSKLIRETFSSGFEPYSSSEFEALLQDCAQTVDAAIKDLGGTPVIFDNTETSTTEIGVIEGCAGFSTEKWKWEMVVNTPYLAVRSDNPRLALWFEPGEIAQSYERALSHPYVFLTPSAAPRNRLIRGGLFTHTAPSQSLFSTVARSSSK